MARDSVICSFSVVKGHVLQCITVCMPCYHFVQVECSDETEANKAFKEVRTPAPAY